VQVSVALLAIADCAQLCGEYTAKSPSVTLSTLTIPLPSTYLQLQAALVQVTRHCQAVYGLDAQLLQQFRAYCTERRDPVSVQSYLSWCEQRARSQPPDAVDGQVQKVTSTQEPSTPSLSPVVSASTSKVEPLAMSSTSKMEPSAMSSTPKMELPAMSSPVNLSTPQDSAVGTGAVAALLSPAPNAQPAGSSSPALMGTSDTAHSAPRVSAVTVIVDPIDLLAGKAPGGSSRT